MPIISVNVAHNEETTISTKQKLSAKIPPFLPIGQAGMTKHKISGLDTGVILKDLSSAATWLFWTLEHNRDKQTNISVLSAKKLTIKEKRKILKGYKELKAKLLIKRIKREHYLINPKALLPEFAAFETVWDTWVKLP